MLFTDLSPAVSIPETSGWKSYVSYMVIKLRRIQVSPLKNEFFAKTSRIPVPGRNVQGAALNAQLGQSSTAGTF